MHDSGATAAVCPTSNLFLGSGFFDFQAAQAHRMPWGLASDIGGGTSLSPFQTMLAAFYVEQQRPGPAEQRLDPQAWWWHHTAGSAQALGLAGQIGNLAIGCEADFILLNDQATPLLARRCAQAHNLSEWLFAMLVLADDRAIAQTFVQGQPQKNGA
jgi:guanine deaminase